MFMFRLVLHNNLNTFRFPASTTSCLTAVALTNSLTGVGSWWLNLALSIEERQYVFALHLELFSSENVE